MEIEIGDSGWTVYPAIDLATAERLAARHPFFVSRRFCAGKGVEDMIHLVVFLNSWRHIK